MERERGREIARGGFWLWDNSYTCRQTPLPVREKGEKEELGMWDLEAGGVVEQPHAVDLLAGFGFTVSCFVFRVSGLWFRVQGFAFRVYGLGFRVEGLGSRV